MGKVSINPVEKEGARGDPFAHGLMPIGQDSTWFEGECAESRFRDERLKKRFGLLLDQLSKHVGQSVPIACEDWTNTKAAYRFFANKGVNEQAILGGHFQATKNRFSHTSGPILVIQDTTTFSFKRENVDPIGVIGKNNVPDSDGRRKLRLDCGIMMHSSLVVTTQGVPLGLAAVKFWSRSKFKDAKALKRMNNSTRVPIEEKESYRWLENLRQSSALLDDPKRCVHVGDRESDIYELFHAAQELGTHFLVRTCVDRVTGDGEHKVSEEMEEVRLKGLHRITTVDAKGVEAKVVMELRFRRIEILPPLASRHRLPSLRVTVIHAQERNAPPGRKPIEWKLLTNLPITSRRDAIEKLDWYALRWKIEVFHKILKSGCNAEESRLETAERLTNLIAVYCIISWRIFWLTMLNRTCPQVRPELALTSAEIDTLNRLVKDTKRGKQAPPLTSYLEKIAQLGGYLARVNDPPPGTMAMWRGMRRLADIQFGIELASR